MKVEQMRANPLAFAACLLAGSAWSACRAEASDAAASAEMARLQSAAASGNADSELALAQAYDEGKLVERDPRAAAQWYGRAAEKGIGIAELELGVLSERGDGVAQDYQAARAHYHRAAALGSAAAKLRLGMLELEGWGGPRDVAAAVSLLTQAAQEGDHASQKVLADMYYAGVGVKADLHQALAWQEQAAKADDPAAEASVGTILQKLNAEDAGVAREWYQLSAESEYTRGMLGMSSTFLRPGATPDQVEMGRKWLEMAAENGDGAAEFYLAGFYLVIPGYSTQPDSASRARALLEQSFKGGQFLSGEVLAASGMTLADAWKYVLSVPMEQRYVQRFADKVAEAEQNPTATHPPYIIKIVHPVYPTSLRLLGTEGNVVVDFIVDTTGRVRKAHAVQSSHPGFSEAAVIAVDGWRFMPGSKEGHLVFTHMQVPVYFRLTAIKQVKAGEPPPPVSPD